VIRSCRARPGRAPECSADCPPVPETTPGKRLPRRSRFASHARTGPPPIRAAPRSSA
jgi:hypothetical protein